MCKTCLDPITYREPWEDDILWRTLFATIHTLRKPICDIVFCVMSFLYVEFSVLCTMLHILDSTIHEVEPKWRTNEERRTRV